MASSPSIHSSQSDAMDGLACSLKGGYDGNSIVLMLCCGGCCGANFISCHVYYYFKICSVDYLRFRICSVCLPVFQDFFLYCLPVFQFLVNLILPRLLDFTMLQCSHWSAIIAHLLCFSCVRSPFPSCFLRCAVLLCCVVRCGRYPTSSVTIIHVLFSSLFSMLINDRKTLLQC